MAKKNITGNSLNFKTGLNKDKDIPRLYVFLIIFEKHIKSKVGTYNFEDSPFKKFCDNNDIKCVKSMAERELKKKSKYGNYFFFSVSTNNKVSKDDVAHHLFRHIRNSIAHALVEKNGNTYYLTDKNTNGNPSMEAKIKIDLFDSFISELEKTKKIIPESV